MLGQSVFLLLFTSFGVQDSNGPGSKQVQKDVKRLLWALDKADIDTTLSFAPPRMLEIYGGKQKAKAILKPMFQDLLSEHRLISLSFSPPPVFFESGGDDFVIVPIRKVIREKGVVYLENTYQVGSKPKASKHWKYLILSGPKKEICSSLFPKFPSGYKFSKITRKKR